MDPLILSILSKALIAAVVMVGLACLQRSARSTARREGVAGVIEYGRALRVLVVASWLFLIGLGIAAGFAQAEERFVAACVTAGFFFLVLSMHLEFFHVVIRYDAEGLRLSSPWRGERFVPWAAITGADYSHLLQWYVLSTAGYGRIRLHRYLSGLGSLREELAARGIALPVVR